jgi:hypothetical protein
VQFSVPLMRDYIIGAVLIAVIILSCLYYILF